MFRGSSTLFKGGGLSVGEVATKEPEGLTDRRRRRHSSAATAQAQRPLPAGGFLQIHIDKGVIVIGGIDEIGIFVGISGEEIEDAGTGGLYGGSVV